MRTPRRLVIVAFAALALGGCGSSDTDRAEVRTVVERFYEAVRNDDAETMFILTLAIAVTGIVLAILIGVMAR